MPGAEISMPVPASGMYHTRKQLTKAAHQELEDAEKVKTEAMKQGMAKFLVKRTDKKIMHHIACTSQSFAKRSLLSQKLSTTSFFGQLSDLFTDDEGTNDEQSNSAIIEIQAYNSRSASIQRLILPCIGK
uniref:Uncharacterized protein n=1 Tax=Ditylenchus dipsaci TaxID=166011 RepID=A0A915DTB4_9BILA